MSSRALNAIFPVTEIDQVQIPLHNDILVITAFKVNGFKYLNHFTANSNTVITGHVLYQLLGNGRSTRIARTHKHLGTCFHSGDPVNTLMLIKTLIFNGNSSMDQGFRELIIGCPLTVCGGSIDLLQFLNISFGIHIMHIGCFIKAVVFLHHLGVSQNIFLKIVPHQSHKNECAHHHYQSNSNSGHRCDLEYRKKGAPNVIQRIRNPMRLPVLPRLLLFLSFDDFLSGIFGHSNYLPKWYGPTICIVYSISSLIIAHPDKKRKTHFLKVCVCSVNEA